MIDVATFRDQLRQLVAEAQRTGVDADLLVAVSDGARELCVELEARRIGLRTHEQVELVRRLEKQLREYEPCDRVAIICRRLGVGRSRYFELRKLARQSGPRPDSEVIESAKAHKRGDRTP